MSVIDELQTAVSTVAEKVGPSIVGIGRGTRGSGIVLAKGKVLTNAHNLRGDEVTVTFADGHSLIGTVAGYDGEGDLAVIDVDTGAAAALDWGAGDGLTVGTAVFGAGASHGGGTRVTFGLVSAVARAFRGPGGRRIDGSVEHTAPLAPGSSGGALLDAAGRFVGLNTNRIGEGFYLALPADADLRARVDALSRGESPTRPRLGVAVAPSLRRPADAPIGRPARARGRPRPGCRGRQPRGSRRHRVRRPHRRGGRSPGDRRRRPARRPRRHARSRSRSSSSAAPTSARSRSAGAPRRPARPDPMVALARLPDPDPPYEPTMPTTTRSSTPTRSRCRPRPSGSSRRSPASGSTAASAAGPAAVPVRRSPSSPIGYLVTSAHVVAGTERGTATFVDGAELEFQVVGRDPLSRSRGRPDDRWRPSAGATRRRGPAQRRPAGRRHRQPARASPGPSPPASSARSVARSRPATAGRAGWSRTSSRPTPRSTRATPAGRWRIRRGRVIGINTAVAGIGLGLAVPIDASPAGIIDSLIVDGRVRRAFLGIVGGTRPLAREMADSARPAARSRGRPAARARVRRRPPGSASATSSSSSTATRSRASATSSATSSVTSSAGDSTSGWSAPARSGPCRSARSSSAPRPRRRPPTATPTR